MTSPIAPNFETTARYVADTIYILGEPQHATEKHEFRVYDDTGKATIDAHATLDIPLRPNWEDLKVRRHGTRILNVILLGEAMTMAEWYEIPPVIGINSRAEFDYDSNTAKPVLGELWYLFNTKGLIDSGSTVFREGYHNGIQEDVPSIVFDMFDMPKRSRSTAPHLYLADDIEAGSLIDGYSEIHTTGTIDFAAKAADITRETKKPVPESLSRAPRVRYEYKDAIRPEGRLGMSSGLTMFRKTGDYKVITTELRQQAYEGFEPMPLIQNDHFFYGSYTGQDGLPLGVGVDVQQTIISVDGIEEVKPENDADARRMVQPLIQSMANLRRYAKAAYPKNV